MINYIYRASYTHRILDIVTSLDKQTNDTKKIISEIRSIKQSQNQSVNKTVSNKISQSIKQTVTKSVSQ